MAWLKPLDNGAREIRALDGLRAVAALSIVVYHALRTADFQDSALNRQTGNLYFYLSTGVHLFFVLSGFLLFLPFARAMLLGQEFPSTKRFYQRRALRILPAYWVALAILVWLPTAEHTAPLGLGTVITHVLMIHDMFPIFNRDLEGPFWTLAVEAQFYLLLPLLAAGLAKLVAGTRSRGRLLGGIGLLLALALGLRALDMSLAERTSNDASGGFVHAFIYATMGTQGKYLEVFCLGMLCGALYVITVEMRAFSPQRQRRTSWLLLGLAGVLITALALPHGQSGSMSAGLVKLGDFGNPLLVGLGYSILLLAILWGGTAIRWIFETPPIRFIGLISYSLYLWHLPVLHAMISLFAGVPLLARTASSFAVAYVSYQVVERPFLRRRQREKSRELGVAGPEFQVSASQPEMQFGLATWALR